MKHSISKVVVHSVTGPLVGTAEQEFPNLAAATAFIRQFKPMQPNHVEAKVFATIFWDDGIYVGCNYTLTHDIDSVCNPRWAAYQRMSFYAGLHRPANMTDEVHQINLSINAKDGDVDTMNKQCIIWLLEYDLELPLGHECSAEELADLSDEWENPTVDTSKYYQSVTRAWEVREFIYKKWKALGGLCQVMNPPANKLAGETKYYIA
jgi:hypothetical protein